ncbi:transcriptional repressor [Christensenellaceae bacterium OttesenSCG-928-L17]|nr:transcriptional repressor [Christensenellaceae bacterium OttesenSCG-928-L17]
MKYSRKRDAIYEVISSTKTHPSAEWVYTQLKPVYPDLSLGTVYRNIALFRNQGRIMHVTTVHGQERYDANTAQHPHFVCTKCGSVLDVEVATNEAPLLPGVPGARIDGCHIQYFGLCGPCLEQVQMH